MSNSNFKSCSVSLLTFIHMCVAFFTIHSFILNCEIPFKRAIEIDKLLAHKVHIFNSVGTAQQHYKPPSRLLLIALCASFSIWKRSILFRWSAHLRSIYLCCVVLFYFIVVWLMRFCIKYFLTFYLVLNFNFHWCCYWACVCV